MSLAQRFRAPSSRSIGDEIDPASLAVHQGKRIMPYWTGTGVLLRLGNESQ